MRYTPEQELGSMNQSGLSQLKIQLCRQRFPPTNADYFTTGSAVHDRKLEGKYDRILTPEQVIDVEGMCGSLNRCIELDRLLHGAQTEVFVRGKVYGHTMHGTLDILNPPIATIGDIKTTSTKTFQEFVKSARKYGYFRQAFVYCTLTDIKRFVFIGVRKTSPWDVFTLDTSLFKEDMKYAAQEVKFLLELHNIAA